MIGIEGGVFIRVIFIVFNKIVDFLFCYVVVIIGIFDFEWCNKENIVWV